MDDNWLEFLDGLAEQAALEIIESEGTDPEFLTYSETVDDIVEEEDLDDEDREYLYNEVQRLVTTAKVKVKLKKRKRKIV